MSQTCVGCWCVFTTGFMSPMARQIHAQLMLCPVCLVGGPEEYDRLVKKMCKEMGML